MPFTHGQLGLVEFFKESFAEAREDRLVAYAGNLTYGALFALFPFIIFLLSLLAIFHATDLVDTWLHKASQTLPSNMVSLLGTQLRRIANAEATGAFTAGAIVAILGALWGVSRAFRGVMQALNVMYNATETRSFVKRYGLSMFLSLITSALLVASGVLVVAGPALSRYVARITDSGRLFVIAWDILQWPVLVAVVLLAFSLMYYFAPNIKQEFRWITPGAAIAVFFWLLFTLLFSLYVNNVGGHSFSATYGALAGVAIFMIYVHQSAFFFLLGAEMNQVIETRIPRSEEAARGRSALRPPEHPAGASPASRAAAGPSLPPQAARAREFPPHQGARPQGAHRRRLLAGAAAALGLAGIFFRWMRRGNG